MIQMINDGSLLGKIDGMYSHGVLSHYSLLSPLAITSLPFTGCRDRLHLHVAQQDYENRCNYRLKQQILQVQMIQVHWLYSDTPVVSWETRSSLINYLQVEYSALAQSSTLAHINEEVFMIIVCCRSAATVQRRSSWLDPLHSEEAFVLIYILQVHCVIDDRIWSATDRSVQDWFDIPSYLRILGS